MAHKKPWMIVCVRCHEEGDARWVVPGHDAVEILVYLLSIPLLLVPGLLLSTYRSAQAHWASRVCGSKEVVPVDSRRARDILSGGFRRGA